MENLLFVTAQPDVPYFHWQCEVYGYNFESMGIKPSQIHILFGIFDGSENQSEGGKKLREKGYNVHFYSDKRENKHYHPSVKPYLISKWLEQYPENGKLFFLHDSDIVFRKLPEFNNYLQDDNICYLADTKGYIGYEYLNSVCERYEREHPLSEKQQLLREMTDVVGIEIDCLKLNQENSGGGQYIMKNTDSELWNKIYEDSNELYNQMKSYHKRFPIGVGEIQFWTAEMWSVLWNLWCSNKQTKIIEDLNFSWATDDVEFFYKRNILHMAGVLDSMKDTKFYKGEFINKNPILLLRENENYFDYVDEKSATIKYVEIIKSLVKKSEN